MLTIMALFCILLVLSFIVAVITGVFAVSPWLVLLICLPLIDYFVIKGIFGRKKK